MNIEKGIRIFLVDHDKLFLRSLEVEFLQHSNFAVEIFTTGELCVENLSQNPDVIILDHDLNCTNKKAMSAKKTLDEIKSFDRDIPVVMLFSKGKMDVATNSTHQWDFDYTVKNETSFLRLQKIITSIFRSKNIERELNWHMKGA